MRGENKDGDPTAGENMLGERIDGMKELQVAFNQAAVSLPEKK